MTIIEKSFLDINLNGIESLVTLSPGCSFPSVFFLTAAPSPSVLLPSVQRMWRLTPFILMVLAAPLGQD